MDSLIERTLRPFRGIPDVEHSIIYSNLQDILRIQSIAERRKEIPHVKLDESMYHMLLSASGSLYFRNLPAPRDWSSVHRPHVALLYCEDKEVFRFYLSTPCEGDRLCVWDASSLEYDSLVEIKYSDLDYRYYRRENGTWTMVGEARDSPFQELDTYHFGFVKIGTEG
jgi:hypothetical protein